MAKRKTTQVHYEIEQSGPCPEYNHIPFYDQSERTRRWFDTAREAKDHIDARVPSAFKRSYFIVVKVKMTTELVDFD